MDFSFSEDQIALRGLAQRIIADASTNQRWAAAAAGDGWDLELWRTLGEAGLIAIGLPESCGGGGYTALESSVILEEIGRVSAPVPAFAVMALAAPALAAAGRTDVLSGVAAGTTVVTAAVHEPTGAVGSPVTFVANGKLTGTKVCVPAGTIASHFVVTTTDGLYLVASGADGVDIERQDTTTGMPDAMVTFNDAPCERLGNGAASERMIQLGMIGASVMTSGACAGALKLTADYATTRKQFDKPIASFQAVSQRAGDAYIDSEAVRLTAWQAAWRVANGFDASEAVLSAKFWAADGGHRVLNAAQHIHGGVGVDRDYPLHRLYLLVKQLELQLGSATPSLLSLGKILAATPA